MASKEEKTISSLAGISLNDPRVKEIIEQIKNKTSDELTGEVDPFIKFTEQAIKYAPLVTQFVKGITENFRMSQAQQVQPQNIVQAPDGWLSMSLMQKEVLKYKRPNWYKQGIAYDKAVSSAPVLTTPPNYQPPQQAQPIVHETMESIKNKYPEPPLVNDEVPQVEESSEDWAKNNAEIREKEFMRQVENKEQKEEIKKEEQNEMVNKENLIEKMMKDNENYINLAVDYINKLSDTKFIENLNNIETYTKKAKKYLIFIPVQLKESLLMTSDEDFLKLIEMRCKAKYDLMNKDNIEDFKKMFNELKEKLSK